MCVCVCSRRTFIYYLTAATYRMFCPIFNVFALAAHFRASAISPPSFVYIYVCVGVRVCVGNIYYSCLFYISVFPYSSFLLIFVVFGNKRSCGTHSICTCQVSFCQITYTTWCLSNWQTLICIWKQFKIKDWMIDWMSKWLSDW